MKVRRLLVFLSLFLVVSVLSAQRDTLWLKEAHVKVKKERYRRKGNPAVELMQRVIEGKSQTDWHALHPYTSEEQYTKIVFGLNEVNRRWLEEGKLRRMSFLRDQIEVCNATGKLILPLIIDETVTRRLRRAHPESQQDIVLGTHHNGLEQLIDVGDIAQAAMSDIFTEVNVLDDDIRLLQHQITSPLSRRTALSFYRYFIEDTLTIDNTRIYEVSFTPNNPRDFGFAGTLFIAADSTYQLLRAYLRLPAHSGVNWVENLKIAQSFSTLPSGERVLTDDDMVMELRLVQGLQKFHVQRTTHYSAFSTDSIAPQEFVSSHTPIVHPHADRQSEEFWALHRPQPLSRGEEGVHDMMWKVLQTRGFKPIVWVLRALATNSVPLTVRPDRPSKVEIAPFNTLVSFNDIERVRLRLSLRTTAQLMPHVFLRGDIGYGFRDKRLKGMGSLTFALNKRKSIPDEFPVHNLTLSYQNDLMLPTDKFLSTDKNNIFTSLRWTRTSYMMYFQRYRVHYEREWLSGLALTAQLRRERQQFTSQLTTRPFCTADATLSLRYRPGAAYTTTKQARRTLNADAPLYQLSHTLGVSGVLGSEYRYNLTEAEVYRRFQLNSWGHLDMDVRGAVQWNRVPFPLLIMPEANLSYIKQRNTFSLVNNMEFLSDRYASLHLAWDMKGKLFNRIPLLRRAHLREYLGLNMMWGMLSSHGSTSYSLTDGTVISFPSTSTTLSARRPYVEGIIGVHNILRLLHVEYVHRFGYTHLPTAQKWGIRFRIDLGF